MIGKSLKAKDGSGEMAALLELFKDPDKYAAQLAEYGEAKARLQELVGANDTLEKAERVLEDAAASSIETERLKAEAETKATAIVANAKAEANEIREQAAEHERKAKAASAEAATLLADAKSAHDAREQALVKREADVAARETAAASAQLSNQATADHWQEVSRKIAQLVG